MNLESDHPFKKIDALLKEADAAALLIGGCAEYLHYPLSGPKQLLGKKDFDLVLLGEDASVPLSAEEKLDWFWHVNDSGFEYWRNAKGVVLYFLLEPQKLPEAGLHFPSRDLLMLINSIESSVEEVVGSFKRPSNKFADFPRYSQEGTPMINIVRSTFGEGSIMGTNEIGLRQIPPETVKRIHEKLDNQK